MDSCAKCGKPAEHRCSGCREVVYCGKEHQRKHWKEHASSCKAYRLVENPELGRHYVAQRRIASGEVVIREEVPLVQGPQQDTPPVCLGCGCLIRGDEGNDASASANENGKPCKPCPDCGWPLCNSCEKHGSECEFTQRYRDSKVTITGFGIPHPTYKCVSVIRALSLKDKDNAEAFEKFSRLASSAERDDCVEPREVARFVKRFFNKLDTFDEDEIARIAGILQINGHEVPITEPASIAVYDVSSYLEHSCKANCSKSFTNDGGIVIRAAKTIQKGEHLTICYTDPLWGTANRRHHLLRTKYFECTCRRCSDPTEFGTYFDAIKCTRSDCKGSMLPPSFLCTTEKSELPDYVCNECDARLSSQSVDLMIDELGKELMYLGPQGSVAASRQWLETKALKQLHENHFYVTDVRIALSQMIGQCSGGLPNVDPDLLAYKILLCQKLSKLLEIIVPAENRVRGLVFFELHAALAEFGRRNCEDRDQLYTILLESRKSLTEAYQLLRYEPDVLPEGQIAKTARINMREMDLIVQRWHENAVMPL
ncbi:hypothetical protein QAD02_001141 [Eretmocerus hayati]|uniref:Uncharacterized protein n=1 Tax=Eretmocerus hayati TaxID=131215 RepID=A0ACC2NI07_9HYME|nr:hypothetical protein QAD02_001141 [Eretmocerus hayati]